MLSDELRLLSTFDCEIEDLLRIEAMAYDVVNKARAEARRRKRRFVAMRVVKYAVSRFFTEEWTEKTYKKNVEDTHNLVKYLRGVYSLQCEFYESSGELEVWW